MTLAGSRPVHGVRRSADQVLKLANGLTPLLPLVRAQQDLGRRINRRRGRRRQRGGRRDRRRGRRGVASCEMGCAPIKFRDFKANFLPRRDFFICTSYETV